MNFHVAAARRSRLVDAKVLASQKREDAIAAYFPRKVSKYLTPALLWCGFSANQTTVLWGVLNVATSYLVYRAMCGSYELVPAIFGLYLLSQILDCADGEIARYRNAASPIGGKLLDGVCHRAAEYSLLCAYVAGAAAQAPTPLLLVLALGLLSGEAMYTYCTERRVLVIRLHGAKQPYLSRVTPNDLYRSDERWQEFPGRKKLNSLIGLIQYKSIYLVIALSAVSVETLVGGLTLLAVYKHVAWIRVMTDTVRRPPALAGD